MLNSAYYLLKPFIPRALQIEMRRWAVRRTLRRSACRWPIDERASGPPPGWKGWPGGKRFALVLTHDVETERGQDRCQLLAQQEMDLGCRSSFNFVPDRYQVSGALREYLVRSGFEVGVHDLKHDGKLFRSKKGFLKRAARINRYLKDWNSVGFRSGAMLHNLEWIHELDVEYDASTFDTDPFEPQPDGVGTIFPFWVNDSRKRKGYVELPYTLPQDFTLFVLLKEKDIGIWKRKLDWIASKGGAALLITHPDYMDFDGTSRKVDEFPAMFYLELLRYVQARYPGQYWNALPKELASFVRNTPSNERPSAT